MKYCPPLIVLLALALVGCTADTSSSAMSNELQDFATRYTAAWCSQDPAHVAAFFAEDGSLTVNAGTPAMGRAAISEVAQSFMTAFPDMVVTMDALRVGEAGIEYHWTLTGTNTGPGGTGNAVDISGFETWTLSDDGLIAVSQGRFDETEYLRQLGHAEDAE
ncbi:MAG: nuclear transport factor 2 family protein [Bacteroidota bacterium]